MIIPKEAPYKEKIHSYYLKFENFVVSMQEEIGTGCIYCQSMREAHMIYFNAHELVRCVAEEQGRPPRIYHQLGDVLQAFKKRPFIVSVHYLDDQAIYFWGRLPAYRTTQGPISSASGISLAIMFEQYEANGFSGFIDISADDGDGGLLFFQEGKFAGGSFAWGRGGLSRNEDDYRRLVALFESENCTLAIGTFMPAPSAQTTDGG